MFDYEYITKNEIDLIKEASHMLKISWKESYKNILNSSYLSSLDDNHWTEFIKNNLLNKSIKCIIAKYNNTIIGVSIFGKSITKEFPNSGEVISLYVLNEFKGNKIGYTLFTKAIFELKNQNFKDIIICVFKDNTTAINFYKSHGFTVVQNNLTTLIGNEDLPYIIMQRKSQP
ncbi:GNAT family N-acetyltransferase [Miniphocaeibacter massiliensis]|uniref:GNAT family N-acetyltransferase n=1 Tax=Miniphocaeibacter massiliensis TaxID=2041841 RepID=UPI000C1BDABE|nr:GNAT family N-acetyltransferase [Miniphocaeibacter massiliensis]